jgi:hypothetical protein
VTSHHDIKWQHTTISSGSTPSVTVRLDLFIASETGLYAYCVSVEQRVNITTSLLMTATGTMMIIMMMMIIIIIIIIITDRNIIGYVITM